MYFLKSLGQYSDLYKQYHFNLDDESSWKGAIGIGSSM
jgi:hypothetical protein